MARKALTADWSIDLDDTFQGRPVGTNLQLMSETPWTRTIWVSVFATEESATDTMEKIRLDVNPDPVSVYSEGGDDPGELRYASWYPETDPSDRYQWSLYAYTVREREFIALAIISDAQDDEEWALATWRSLRWRATPSKA